MTESEAARVRQAARDGLGEAVTFLQAMVRTPSVNPPGEYEAISQVVDAEFRRVGLDSQRLKVPDARVDVAGLQTPRWNVLGFLRGGSARPTVVLNPHLDTVPVSGEWSSPPFAAEIREGRVIGRGASDSKGRIACYTYALAALARAGVRLRGQAVVAATADEETGGHLGPGYLLESGLLPADYAIVEGGTYSVWIANNGVLHLEVTLQGTPAHASRPERGHDAIAAMGRVLAAIERYRVALQSTTSRIPGLRHPTVVVGTIAGGVKTNVVPDRCTITIDRRVLPDENFAAVEAELIGTLAEAARELPGISFETRVVLRAEPYGPTPEDSPVVQALRRRAREVLGEDIPAVGSSGFGDARFFWLRGIPTANYGPGPREGGNSNAHAGDENMGIEDLGKAIEVLALAVADLAGTT
ncbi:MAG TPA: ArgE/DapE family deacylase [Bacillota bacterium]|nr:ArgE/DapE family deacylase [Bacillota bacterium]